MLVYVIKKGDSIWAIGEKYGVDYNQIINMNGLTNDNDITIGEALLIPTHSFSYTIKNGDTIWSIANKFKIPTNVLIKFNNITNVNGIRKGMVIKIPDNLIGYDKIEVNGFIIPSTPDKDISIMQESIDYLTYITPFSHHVNSDGSLSPLNDYDILSYAKAHNTSTMLSVTNMSQNGFDTKLIGAILNSSYIQQNLINNIISLINEKSMQGVIIDFERIPPEDREKYNNFLRNLVKALHLQNYLLATALAPKTSGFQQGPWYEAHDYKAQGQIVDFTILMTYEWGWSGGPPRAVSPINEVAKVLDYAVSVIPANKIMMGIPNYGYDWTLPYVEGGPFAEALGNQEATERAVKYGAEIKYDYSAEAPYYNYVDANQKQHVVWFEDSRSIVAKFRLVQQYNLRGVSYWTLGKSFSQNWVLIYTMFNIKKLV